MDTNCLDRLTCRLLLEAIAAPPEADEFMAELCRQGGPADHGCAPALGLEGEVILA